MLRSIDPTLSPPLLYALRAMGHGDQIAIVDANFPAASQGPDVLRADSATASDMLRAILSVMPLDHFSKAPALSMQIVGDPSQLPEAVADFQNIINEVADRPAQIEPLERFAFYKRSGTSFVIVQTGERRLYGNIILTKGIIE